MRKKKIAGITVLLMIVTAMTGCGDKTAETNTGSDSVSDIVHSTEAVTEAETEPETEVVTEAETETETEEDNSQNDANNMSYIFEKILDSTKAVP